MSFVKLNTDTIRKIYAETLTTEEARLEFLCGLEDQSSVDLLKGIPFISEFEKLVRQGLMTGMVSSTLEDIIKIIKINKHCVLLWTMCNHLNRRFNEDVIMTIFEEFNKDEKNSKIPSYLIDEIKATLRNNTELRDKIYKSKEFENIVKKHNGMFLIVGGCLSRKIQKAVLKSEDLFSNLYSNSLEHKSIALDKDLQISLLKHAWVRNQSPLERLRDWSAINDMCRGSIIMKAIPELNQLSTTYVSYIKWEEQEDIVKAKVIELLQEEKINVDVAKIVLGNDINNDFILASV